MCFGRPTLQIITEHDHVSLRGRIYWGSALTVKTHKEGKKHFGWSCPAKPAFIVPEPYVEMGMKFIFVSRWAKVNGQY